MKNKCIMKKKGDIDSVITAFLQGKWMTSLVKFAFDCESQYTETNSYT